MSSTSVSAVFCWRQTGHTETPVCPLERASGKVASPGMWVLTRARASSPCTPALHPPSHGVGAAAQPSLFPPGKASPSPWIERLPSGRRSPRPHHAHGQRAQAASAGSERRQHSPAWHPLRPGTLAPRRLLAWGRVFGNLCQKGTSCKRSRKLGYLSVQIFTEETPGGAACQRSSPAGEVPHLRAPAAAHGPARSEVGPFGKPGGDSGERSPRGGTRHGNARGSVRSCVTACVAAV